MKNYLTVVAASLLVTGSQSAFSESCSCINNQKLVLGTCQFTDSRMFEANKLVYDNGNEIGQATALTCGDSSHIWEYRVLAESNNGPTFCEIWLTPTADLDAKLIAKEADTYESCAPFLEDTACLLGAEVPSETNCELYGGL